MSKKTPAPPVADNLFTSDDTPTTVTAHPPPLLEISDGATAAAEVPFLATAPAPNGKSRVGKSLRKPEGKLRLTNGYFIDFALVSRLLKTLNENSGSGKLRTPNADLADAVGLSDARMQFLCSTADALGLLVPVQLLSTPLGKVVYAHDPHCDDAGTFWITHYCAASQSQNIVWHHLFYKFLPEIGDAPFTREEWLDKLAYLYDTFSKETVIRNTRAETRCLLNAYTVQSLARLNFLRIVREVDGDETGLKATFAAAYPDEVPPLVLAASLARFRDTHRPHATALPITDLLHAPGCPGIAFRLDEFRLRASLESLKNEPGISLESRADLDQVRLTDQTPDHVWMERYYARR